MSDVVWTTTANGIADASPGEHSVIGVSSGLAATEAARLQAQADAAGYKHRGQVTRIHGGLTWTPGPPSFRQTYPPLSR